MGVWDIADGKRSQMHADARRCTQMHADAHRIEGSAAHAACVITLGSQAASPRHVGCSRTRRSLQVVTKSNDHSMVGKRKRG